MYLEPMEIESEINWDTRPRKGKRTCKYLSKEEDEVRVLPEPVNQQKLEMKFPDDIECKKIRLTREWKMPSLRVPVRFIRHYLDPALLIGVMHVVMNFFLVSVVIYSVGYVLYFARMDIMYKLGMKRAEVRAQIEDAKRLYALNKCSPGTRVPAMETQCEQWGCIIDSGLSGVKYMRIVAELVAEVVDGFVERFRIRNLAVILVFFCTVFYFGRRVKRGE